MTKRRLPLLPPFAALALLAIPAGLALWAQAPPDTDPPQIHILESGTDLTDGRLFNRAATPVLQITDASTFTVDAVLDGAAFTSGAPVSGEGTHLLSVTATDAAGNAATVAVGFEVDTTPPAFLSLQPDDAAILSAAQVTLMGQVAGAVSMKVDGQPATLAGQDFTAGPYTLAEGARTWTLVAADAAGNTAQRSLHVARDSQAPTVAISQPPVGAIVKDGAVDVVGNAQDPQLSGVAVNGVAATVTGTTWLARQVPLAEGSNTLTARAEDRAGNASQATRTLERDSTPPALVITDPAPGSVVPGASITLRGTAGDSHLDRVEVNGVRATLTGAAWSMVMALHDGVNDFTVQAFDKVSNSAQATISVTRDSDAPAVHINLPADGARLNAATVTVSGTVDQEAGLTLTVNGVAATITGGTFSAAGVPLVEGNNTLIARVTDSVGNQGTHTRVVVRDTVAPKLDSADPASGALALPVDAIFRLTFSEDMAEPAAGSWRLETGAGQAIPATANRAGSVLTVRPSVPLPSSAQVRLVLTAALVDLAGNALAAPPTLTFLTVDTTAPPAPVFAPAPPQAVCADSITLAGTAEAGAVVRVDGAGAAAETRADENGHFSLAVQLLPGSLNRLQVTATDAGGNVSPPAVAAVVHDCAAPRVVSADHQSNAFHVVFSEPVTPASLAGAIQLSASFGPIPGTVSLATNGLTATFTSAGSLPAGALRLEVTTAVKDLAGNAMAYPWSQVFGAQGGSGFLLGTVIDNATGRPLAGARVLVTATNGTALPEPLPEQVTGEDGRFRLPVPAGTHDLTIVRPGYAPAFRLVTSGAGQGTEIFDPRLTPAAKAQTLGSSGGTWGAGTDAILTLPAGALAESVVVVAATRLDEQGLPMPLPYGWSPRGAAWVDLGGVALLADSTLSLPVESANGTTLVLAHLDLASLQWRVVGTAQVSGTRVTFTLPAAAAGLTDGGWAALEADSGPLAPPAPVTGAVLGASARPAGNEATAATLTFNPEVVLPSQSSQATVLYTVSQGVASGLPLTMFIEEELTLLDNSVRRQTPYQADLILYHAADGPPRSRFQLRPSAAAQALPLKLGAENVTLRTYGGEAVAGNVVSSEGGTVTNDQGDRIDLPPGAVTEPTAIVVTRKAAADLGLAVPAGTELAGVVDLDLGGKSLLVPAALSLALSPAPASGEKGLLLQVIDLESGKAFRAVAALQATPSGWTTAAIDPTDLAWPGVRDEGLYAFVRLTAPTGYLRGTIFDVGGAALADAVVRGSGAGWLQISNASGSYVLPAPVVTLTATAENRVTGNQGAAAVTVPAADARVDLDITLLAVGPHVVAITPADGAVDVPQGIQPTVRFSEAVNPALGAGAIQLLSDGQPVAVDLQVQGVLVRVTPKATLLPATAYELRVTSGVHDLQGNPLESPVASTFITLRVLASNDVNLTRIFLVAPDATGQARVLGRPGAVPANALVFVENRSALVTTPSVTAGQDGSFDLNIQAALTHTLILHVLIPNSNEIVALLTPFRTPDLKGAYVDDKAVTFTTGEGLTAAIPAGAFSGPTIVSVASRPISQSPVLARDAFAPVASFTLDFSGAEAHKALAISLPLPAGAPTPVGGFYLLNRVVEALGDHCWMMHDLMRLDTASGRLTTEEASTGAAAAPVGAGVAAVVASLDSPFALAAASQSRLPRAIAAASIVPHHKQYVPGAAFPGQYQIEAPTIPLGFTIFPVFDMNSQVGVWNLGLDGIFASMNGSIARLLDQDGVLIPTRLDRPSRFVVRDLGTGFRLFDATLPPPTAETPVELPPDIYGDKTPPYPVGGTPIRFFPVDVVVDGRQDLDRGIHAEVASGRVTITGEAGSAGDTVAVRLIGLDDDSYESSVTGANGSFTLTHSPGHDAKRFLLAIGAKVPADQAFEVSFSEALDPGFTDVEVLDSHGKKLDPAKRPVGNQAVLRLEPKAGWQAKERYTLRLGPEMRDAIGNTWKKTLEIEFEVTSSTPINTYPLAAARDVARLGSLLFVAGDTTGLVVLDAGDPSNLRVNGTYPFPLADAVTAVAIDPHGRVLVAGGGIRAQGQLRIFDPLTMSYKGSTILSDVLGGPGTQLPAGTPQRLAVLSQDQTSEWIAGKPAPAGLTLEPPAVPTDEAGADVPEYTLLVHGTGTAKLPVTLQDVTAGRWYRVDAATDGSFQVSLSVRPGDQLRLLRNAKTIAYVLTRGVGVEVVDVNAFYNESGNRVLSDVLGIYSGFQDPQLRLCGEAVADLSSSVSDLGTLFDPANLNPLTLVGLVGFRGLVLLRSDPTAVSSVSFLNEACADVSGSRNVSGLLVLQNYAFDLNNDGLFTPDERRDYILVSHQQAGVLIYDASDRENLVLVGRIRVPGMASRLGVDRDSHRLFVSALGEGFYVVDLSRKPSVDLIDVNGDGIDDRVLETVHLTGNTNAAVSLVPELGLAYVGGLNRGLTSVAVGHPEIEILARDSEGHERQVERLAPFGVPTAPESSDPQAKKLPGSIRILASLPGFSGSEAHLDVIAEDMGGFPIPEAGDPDTTEGLPRASWTGDHSMVLHRLAEHPWEPGYERYSSKDIALITDLRASAGYKRTSEENDVCVRCDQTQEKVAKDAHQLLSGDYIRIAFSQSLRDQLSPIYDRERLDSAEKRLTSVRWELSPAPKQETEQNPAFSQAPGVLAHSGELSLSATDLAIPGRGLDLVFQRTYRSQTVGSGTLGPGWDSNVYERLQELPTGDVAHFDGRGRRDQFKKETNGDLTAPPGVFATLEKVSTGWVMIDAHHATTRFDRFGRMISIADPVKDSKDTGSEMTFHYGPGRQLLRVHDSLDRDIRFEYDDKQRLKKIIDFTDREFYFEYDSAGRLVKTLTPTVVTVLAPDEVLVTQNDHLTTEYVYDQATGSLTKTLGARDNIKSVKDAKNQSWLQVNYASASDDKAPQKVESEVWGGGSMGLQYGDNAATVTDALGHNFAYTFSPKGQITGVKDPTNAEVHYTYDDEGLVTSRTDPLGRVTQYFYDAPCNGDPIGKSRSRGNLTRVVVTAGANGANGPSNTVETCTDYEPYSNQPVKVVDPRGIVTLISRTEVGLPERIEQGSGTPDSSVTETHYNEFGQPILVFNPNRHTTEYQYSNSDPSTGYLEKITIDRGGLNLVTRFETDARGNVTRMIDPRGVGFTRVYNDLDWVVESHRASTSALPDAPALDYVTTYFYDPNGNPSEVRLPYGDDGSTFTRVQYAYGPRNELLGTARQVKPGDHASDWAKEYLFYDDALNLIKTIEPESQTTRYVYDQRNLLSAMVQGYDTPDAVTLGFGYDADGRRIAFNDGRQSIWTTAYDGFGRVWETRDPLGNRATVLYDNGGNPVETSVYQPPANATDPPTLLARRSAQYDALNRVRSTTAKLWSYDPLHPDLPDGATSLVTQKTYDADSNLLSVTDPLSRVSHMEYDHAERLVASVDAVGNRSEHDLDPTGHPLAMRSIEQRSVGGSITVTVQSSYDALGRLSSTTDGLGNTQRYVYDARNNLRLSIDAEGNVTERSYDGLDRLTRQVQPEGISVDYGYDRSSRVISYQDALNQETDYTYDVLNRRTAVLYPSPSGNRPRELYTYDANGNPTQITDPNGTVVTQAFDTANRLTGRTVAPASGILGPTAESFTYDGMGRMTHTQSGNVATDLTFDSLSRLTHERNAGRDLSFDYDGAGNALRVQYPSGFALGQSFDALNRPLSIGRANGTPEEAVSYGYRGPDLVASESLFNGLAGTREYDAARRLLDETFRTASGQAVFRERLAWTPRSLKSAQSRSDLNNRGLIFAYDGASRLTQAGKSPDPLAVVTNNTVAPATTFNNLPDVFAYNYDKAQNLLARTEKKNDVPQAVALPLDNSKRNRPASVGPVALEWDSNGNLTRKGDFHFAYDYRNRLTRVTRGTGEEVATYQYDAFNRRVKKTVGSENREITWHGWQPVEEYKNGGLDQRRIYGLGLDEIVQLQVDLDGNGDPEQKYAPVYDSTGNLAEITGSNGKPIERYEYTPYGQRKIFVDNTPPAVEQVRVKGNALWVEMSEEISQDALAKAVADHTLILTNLAIQQPISIDTVTQPVVAGRQARRRLVITTTGPPAANTQVRLTLPAAALQDSFLNQPAQDFQFTFAWPAGDAVLQDNKPIQLHRVAVRDGSLEIELSEEPNLATTNAIQIDGATMTWVLGDDRYTLKSANPLASGSHALAIGTTLADLNGGTLAQAFNANLSVAAHDNLAVFEAPDPRESAASTIGNRFGFQGLSIDPETGLIYVRNRYYDPELGRFISVDPKGYVDGPSMYALERNDPANGRDPMGLCEGFSGCFKAGVDWVVNFFTEPAKKGADKTRETGQHLRNDSDTYDNTVRQSHNRATDVEEMNYPEDEQAVHDLARQKQHFEGTRTIAHETAQATKSAAAAGGYFLDAAMRAQIAKDAYEAAAAAGKSVLERQAAAKFAVDRAEQEAAAKAAAKKNGLDWDAVVPKKGKYKGESRVDHVARHEVDVPTKPEHGVFLGPSKDLTDEAWARAQQMGLKPNPKGVLTVPMGRQVGWAGGKEGSEAAVPLDNVTIIVKPGTNHIITSYPGGP